jgi:hypothetical protein
MTIVLNECWVLGLDAEHDFVLQVLRDRIRGYTIPYHVENLTDHLLGLTLLGLSNYAEMDVYKIDLNVETPEDDVVICMEVTPNRRITCYTKMDPVRELLTEINRLHRESAFLSEGPLRLALEKCGWTK